MPTGTVKWFNQKKGFGFIQPSEGRNDVFLHISAIDKSGLGIPQEGQKIQYDIVNDRDGKTCAGNLRAA